MANGKYIFPMAGCRLANMLMEWSMGAGKSDLLAVMCTSVNTPMEKEVDSGWKNLRTAV